MGALGRRQGSAARVPADLLQARSRRRGAGADGRHRLRDHDRPGRARRAAHRQGLRGRRPHHRHPPPPGPQDLGRRRARRTTHRPDHPLPQRQRAGGRPRPDGPDPHARPSRSPGCCATGRAWCTSSPCSRRCRCRRPSTRSASCRMPASASAPSSSTRCVSRSSTRRCSRPRPPSRTRVARPGARRPHGRGGARRAAHRAAACCDEAHDHAERVELERSLTDEVASQGLPTLTLPVARERHRGRRHRGARRRAARPGGALMAARPAAPRARRGPPAAARTAPDAIDIDALLADPGTGIIVCCGSGGVGKTTTAAALGRARGRGRAPRRRAHHRPGPPAGPVARAHRARQHPPTGGRRRRRRRAGRCTR